MLLINKDKLKEKENTLIYFNGFIPMEFFKYIDMFKRNNYLKSINKFDEIEKENIKVRKMMKSNSDAVAYSENVLKKWIVDNPQFKDLLIFD